MNLVQKLIKYNFYTGRDGNDILYIVVHDTGNPGTGADAMAHYTYFNGGDRQSSAHYFVDDHQIVQTVEDQNTSWHCGDGYGKYGITNRNSIGIELCINSDGNYDQAVSNTAALVRKLMLEHHIPIERVVRHYDASRKVCPGSMSANNWQKWYAFKKEVEKVKQFNDVASDRWSYQAIQEVCDMGIMNGTGTDTFEPDAPLTREQAAVVARNVVRYITGK